MSHQNAPTEVQLKAKLLNELRRRRRISQSTTIANEMPIGTTKVRADLVFYSKFLCGIEIKSERDSLKRLSRQLSIYQEYFDRTILLIAEKHRDALGVLDIDINCLELWISSGLSLRREHTGITEIKGHKQVELLTIEQQRKYFYRESNKLHANKEFKLAFRERYSTTSKLFWKETKGRKIEPKDLNLLSRFEIRRQLEIELEEKKKRLKKEWEAGLIQSVHSSSVS